MIARMWSVHFGGIRKLESEFGIVLSVFGGLGS